MAGDKLLFVLAPIFLCPLLSRALSGDRRFAAVYAQQAPWQPPGWVFGIVWPVLYGLLGYSLALAVESESGAGVRDMLVLFALNVCWTPIFLRGNVTGALALLLVMIAQAGWVVDQTPLLTPYVIPYILWLTFAATLNAYYVRQAHDGVLAPVTETAAPTGARRP